MRHDSSTGVRGKILRADTMCEARGQLDQGQSAAKCYCGLSPLFIAIKAHDTHLYATDKLEFANLDVRQYIQSAKTCSGAVSSPTSKLSQHTDLFTV